jgi:four helix bundle protein
MRNFKELKIWQKGMEIAEMGYKLIDTLPQTEKFGLRSQISRAAVSIPSNIAEGGSRISVKEYRHYLRIALGSCFELETQLLILQRIKTTNNDNASEMLAAIIEEQKMISGLLSKLES